MEETSIKVILVTVPNQESALHIAQALVEKKIAACVSILPQITSVYRWEGEIHQDQELLLLIKTAEQRYQELESEVLKLHPYKCPEIIALPVSQGLDKYYAWVKEQTDESLF